eukprot:jgi/Mesvir1/5052/Mv02253-RA.1
MELTRISPANGLTYGFVCLTLLASVWGHSIDDVVPCFHDELTSTIAPFRRMPTQSSTAGVKGRQGTRQTSPVGDIMRVKTIYQLDSLDQHFASDPTRAAEVRAFLQEKLVPSAVGYLRKVLRLRDPVEGNLLLTRSCLAIRAGNPPECLQWNTNSCLEGTLDESFYAGRRTCSSTGSCTSVPDGKGVVDADLVIVITAVKSSLCTSSSALLALAQHCTQDPDTDRPTSGGVNFCPDNINTNYDDDITWLQQLNTAVHELVHVLGFSSSLFPYYRDAAGNPRTPRDAYGAPLGDSTIRTGADGVMKMVTPRVVEAARAQLSCASLDGAEVENYGGPATARSHWEARLWNSELMMGSISRDRVLSNLTLAALEDSGWYLPVWQQAALLRFGRGQGCAFALESCAPRANFPFVFAGEYCDGQPRYTTDNGQQLEMSDYCTANDYAVGFCTACTEGVASSTCLYDGCRTVQGYTRGRCDDLSNVGSSNNVNAPEYWGQRYSIASRCFPDGGASWVKREYRRPAQGAGCYPRRCERDTLEDGGYGPWRLLVEVGAGNWVRCVDGQVVDASQGSNPVSSFTTAVIGPCPVAADYCPFNSCPEECFRNGVCNNGRCNCYAGYEGNNCGLRLCLDGTCAPGQYCDVASGMCKWPVAPPPPEYLRRRVQVTGNVTFARGTTGSAAAVPTLVAQALHAALEGAEGVLSSTVDAEGSLADNGRRIRFHMTVEAYDDSEGLASFLDTLRGDPTPLFAGAPVLVAMSPATTLGLLVSETAPPSPPNPPPAPPSAPPPSPFSPPRSTDIAGISRTGFVIAMCGAGVGVVVVAAIIYLIAARRKTKRIIKEQEAVLRDIHSYFNTPVMTPRVGLSRAASGARSPFAAMDAGVGPDGAPISPRSTTMARSRLGTPLASPRASTPHAVSPFGAVPDAPPPRALFSTRWTRPPHAARPPPRCRWWCRSRRAQACAVAPARRAR